ncbi:sensor histidine kinase [Streptomyces sp. NPDC053367]|uniref:sensor histidine kinase n=1 Tax=Streptomyces sp. NPDC053367 TaxID=3365700 RepID=UPI0037D5823B
MANDAHCESGCSSMADEIRALGGPSDPEDERVLLAPRTARSITVCALVWFAAVAVLNVLWSGTGGKNVLLCIGCALAVCAMGIVITSARARSWSRAVRIRALACQALLTALPYALFGANWGSMAGPLAGSLLYLIPGRTGRLLFGGVMAGQLAVAVASHQVWVMTAYLTLATGFTGMVIYGLARLSELVQRMHETRGERARAAVVQERLRFARDLHDLLGYSLSAITLKSELIHRLIPTRPDRATEEVQSVLAVSRQALADVRLVASGYRSMSLAEEADSAAGILAAAEIDAEVEVGCGRLHPVVDTVLATTLREGVTNLLRHSVAQRCRITAERRGEAVRLTLVNDGVTGLPSRTSDTSGSGLGNLRIRLQSIGGRIESGVHDGGTFRLVAEAPARPQMSEAFERAAARMPTAGTTV